MPTCKTTTVSALAGLVGCELWNLQDPLVNHQSYHEFLYYSNTRGTVIRDFYRVFSGKKIFVKYIDGPITRCAIPSSSPQNCPCPRHHLNNKATHLFMRRRGAPLGRKKILSIWSGDNSRSSSRGIHEYFLSLQHERPYHCPNEMVLWTTFFKTLLIRPSSARNPLKIHQKCPPMNFSESPEKK